VWGTRDASCRVYSTRTQYSSSKHGDLTVGSYDHRPSEPPAMIPFSHHPLDNTCALKCYSVCFAQLAMSPSNPTFNIKVLCKEIYHTCKYHFLQEKSDPPKRPSNFFFNQHGNPDPNSTKYSSWTKVIVGAPKYDTHKTYRNLRNSRSRKSPS